MGFRHETPFDRRRESCATSSPQPGGPDFGDDPFCRHTTVEDTSDLSVSSASHIIRQSPVIARQFPEQYRFGMTAMQAGHYFSSSSNLSILSFDMRIYMFLLFTRITGPSPQAPMHSLSTSVNRPSGVVSPNPILSFSFRYCAV